MSHAVAGGLKLASTGARSTVLRSLVNQASAPGPAIATCVAPLTGSDRSSAIRQRGSFQRVPSYCEADGRREGDAGLTGGGSQVGGRDLDRIDADRQRHGLPALQPRQRPDDPPARDLLIEPAAGLTRDDLDREPAPDELRLDVAAGRSPRRVRRA